MGISKRSISLLIWCLFGVLSLLNIIGCGEDPTSYSSSGTHHVDKSLDSVTTPSLNCAVAFEDRIRITSVDVSERIETKHPVILASLPDGSARVAWTTKERTLHIADLTADDQVKRDLIIDDVYRVWGFVAHSDGRSAALVVPMSRNAALDFVVFAQDGSEVVRTNLVEGSYTGGDFITFGGGRLLWTGTHYVALYAHERGESVTKSHQADAQTYLTADGRIVDGGWKWGRGCSHSLTSRMAMSGSTVGAAIVCDHNPAVGIVFIAESRSPVYRVKHDAWINLGNIVPTQSGFLINFTCGEDRDTYDRGFVKVQTDGTVDTLIFHDTPENEIQPQMARYGDHYLISWYEMGEAYGQKTLHCAVINEKCAIIEGPVRLENAEMDHSNDIVTFANGDVAWAYSWQDLKTLGIVRVLNCAQ